MTLEINSWKSIQFINQEIGKRYKTSLFSDLIIITKDGKVNCHQVILALASDHLRELFLQHRASSDEDIVMLLPEQSLAHLENVLSHLYNGADVNDFITKPIFQETLTVLGIHFDKSHDICSNDDIKVLKAEPSSMDNFCVKMEEPEIVEKADFTPCSHFLQELCEEGEELTQKTVDENIELSDVNDLCNFNNEKTYFNCDICQRRFSQQSLLNLHKQQHYSGEAFECLKCPKIFTSQSRMKKHLCKHNDNQIIEAKSENRLSKIKTEKDIQLKINGTKMMKEKPDKKEETKKNKEKIKQNFDCEHCDKKFTQKSHLERHMDKHGDPQYHCNICGRMFKSKKGLEYHIKIHEENFQHKCETCDRAFVTRQKLLMHIRAKHTGEKPYVCEVCGTGFTRSDKLTVHKRRLHTGERPYKCHECDWAGVDSSALIHHKKKHATEARRVAEGKALARRLPADHPHHLVKQELGVKRENLHREAPTIQDLNTQAQQVSAAMQAAFPAHMEQFKYYYQNKF